MKKSFKKAGAAVLSMAMLLSMGAISMPVYADLPTHGNVVPTQVSVTIANSSNATYGGNSAGTGAVNLQDDEYHKYQYLDGVTEADVTMYRVATLGNSGWAWDPTVKTALEANGDVITDFETLLTKTLDGENASTDPSATIPLTSSEDLQALAGKLQSIATATGSSVPNVATAKIHKLNDGWETVYLPKDDELFADGKVKNIIGYYLIVTTTEEAGYVMQPVLVPISNETTADPDSRNVKALSLKGVQVSVDKQIEDIYTKVDKDDKVKTTDTAAEGDKTYSSDANISEDKNNGIIDADDTVHYVIKADVPVYSKLASADGTYVITDAPDAGIDVISRDVNGYVKTVQTSTATNKNGKIEVYYSSDATLDTTNDTKLTEFNDYVLAPYSASGGNGFTVTMTLGQLRGAGNGTGYASALAENTTMEGGHIFVVFDAQTNPSFNSAYEANDDLLPAATLADITLNDVAAQIDTVKNGVADATVTLAKSKVIAANLTTIPVGTTTLDDLYTNAGWDKTKTADIEKMQTAAYLALSAKQRERDEANALTEDGNKTKNGTKNIAKVAYNKSFTGDGEPEEVEDVTKLFAAILDLTKVVYEANTVSEIEHLPLYVTGITATEQDAGGTFAEGTVFLKAVDTDADDIMDDASSWETTTNKAEATYASSGNKVKVVSAVATSTDSTSALSAGTGKAYLKDGTTLETTDVEANAKTQDNATGNYADAYAHSKPVMGAVFELAEVYDTVAAADGRVGGTDGTHARTLAISDENGKFYYLAVANDNADSAPTTLTKTIDSTTKGQNTSIEYYEKNDDGETYTTYYVTNSPAWDRVGEGNYQLTEKQAPTGYKKLASPATFTVTDAGIEGDFVGTSNNSAFWAETGKAGSETATFTFTAAGHLQNDILNDYDDTLPATGGIGTVLFTAGGISIVLIAGALFVMYMKKKNSEEEE